MDLGIIVDLLRKAFLALLASTKIEYNGSILYHIMNSESDGHRNIRLKRRTCAAK